MTTSRKTSSRSEDKEKQISALYWRAFEKGEFIIFNRLVGGLASPFIFLLQIFSFPVLLLLRGKNIFPLIFSSFSFSVIIRLHGTKCFSPPNIFLFSFSVLFLLHRPNIFFKQTERNKQRSEYKLIFAHKRFALLSRSSFVDFFKPSFRKQTLRRTTLLWISLWVTSIAFSAWNWSGNGAINWTEIFSHPRAFLFKTKRHREGNIRKKKMCVRIEQSIGHKSSKNTSIHRCLCICRIFPIGFI